jgi:hypothetical protein
VAKKGDVWISKGMGGLVGRWVAKYRGMCG